MQRGTVQGGLAHARTKSRMRRCCAVHPGYGFLSENAEFVDSCEAAGVAFLGPTGATMRMFSRKHTAREFAQNANVPVLPGALLGQRFGLYALCWAETCNAVKNPSL